MGVEAGVELLIPVMDPLVAESLNNQILSILFADNVKSRELLESGSYRRRSPGPGEMPIDAQRVFLTQAQVMG